MGQLLLDILASNLRKALSVAAGSLITYGVVNEEQAAALVTGLVSLGVSIAWSAYQRYKDRLNFLTALEAPPGTSETVVKKELAKAPDAPSVL